MFNCVIIDDEPLAIEKLKRFILKTAKFEIINTFENAKEAATILNIKNIDLYFLDIQMPTITGLEFLKKHKITRPVIFTTAYDKYAIESFDVNVIDYLLKPYTYERFYQAVLKAENVLIKERALENHNDFILINSEHQIFKIYYSDLIYVEGLKDYVKIYTSKFQKPILSRQNLKKIESQLPTDLFFRIHRSYIVSLSKISSVSKQKVVLNAIEVPIGDNFKEIFLKKFF